MSLLFGDIGTISKPTPAETRRRKAKLAFNATSDKWRAAYQAFILEYAERHETFIAEAVRKAFEADPTQPRLLGRDYRASGQIFTKLVSEGKLKRVGHENSVERVSPMPLYTKG